MPSFTPPKKNFASGYTFYVSLAPRTADGTWQANPTLAAGDVKISIDDGAPANLATLPAVDADFTKRVKVVLSQAETNGDNLSIIFSDAAGDEWCDLTVNLQTAAQTLDEMDTVIDAILADTAVIGALGAGLTAIPWNAAWDAEVQSEVADALAVYDPPTNTEMVAAFTEVKGATWAATDTLEAIRDRGDAAWTTATGFATQASVDDLPTNAELATALGTADDATLAAIAALNNLSAAQVNAEVVDALATDTYAEPAQGTPAATASITTKLGWLFAAFRNKKEVTATAFKLYADDGATVITKSTLADDATTFSETEKITGP